MTDRTIDHPGIRRPERFTRERLDWVPWLAPLAQDELTQRHLDGLVDARRAASPYFALLARDPEVLGARTRADLDIFHNRDGGLPRAERELAAAATSRVNGCVYCAHVHAGFAAHYANRPDDVDRILADGVGVRTDARWDAVVDAAAALTATPVAFGVETVEGLRDAGLDDAAVLDVVQSAAFFAWANRLMLSLGEPAVPSASSKA